MRFVEPSGLVSNVMGRMPEVSFNVQATSSVFVSMTLMTLVATEPDTANFPSGVTYTL